jgi:hypothetical protein
LVRRKRIGFDTLQQVQNGVLGGLPDSLVRVVIGHRLEWFNRARVAEPGQSFDGDPAHRGVAAWQAVDQQIFERAAGELAVGFVRLVFDHGVQRRYRARIAQFAERAHGHKADVGVIAAQGGNQGFDGGRADADQGIFRDPGQVLVAAAFDQYTHRARIADLAQGGDRGSALERIRENLLEQGFDGGDHAPVPSSSINLLCRVGSGSRSMASIKA